MNKVLRDIFIAEKMLYLYEFEETSTIDFEIISIKNPIYKITNYWRYQSTLLFWGLQTILRSILIKKPDLILYNIIITITINNSNRQKVMGIKYTQHKDISWSKRYRGKVALIHTKKIIWNRSFIEKEIDDINPKILKGPPKK